MFLEKSYFAVSKLVSFSFFVNHYIRFINCLVFNNSFLKQIVLFMKMFNEKKTLLFQTNINLYVDLILILNTFEKM